jgi:hypothetical protein
MPTIVIDIPTNADAAEARDAICARYGYVANLPNPLYNPALPADPVLNPVTIPNPETKSAFAKRMLALYVRQLIRAYRQDNAYKAADAGIPVDPDIT